VITVSVHKAKTELSRLLKRVAEGEEVVIAKAGKPVAKLIDIRPPARRKRLGLDRSDWKVPQDFNDPLPEELSKALWHEET
jgi:prevent-host-death family protein